MHLGSIHVEVHPVAAVRRFVIALVSIAIIAAVFHNAVASGLVTRGDNAERAGRISEAMVYYDRALWWDPSWERPVDRIGFALSETGEYGMIAHCIAVTSAYLAKYPDSEKVRWDRAVCRTHKGDRSGALTDYEALARTAQGPKWRYADIAAHLALRLGRVGEAREFARLARAR